MIRLVVADDQAMIRQALISLLNLEDDLTVVAGASDGQELLSVMTGDVDVVLMDVEMPRLDGLTACAAVKNRWPSAQVLVVTTFGRPGYVRRALEAGAGGFIVKDAPLPELLHAIRQVAAGKQVIDPALAIETLTHGESPLTPRETEVLQHLRGGRSTTEVAKALELGSGTVRNYLSSAIDKTGAQSATEAATIAESKGWLPL